MACVETPFTGLSCLDQATNLYNAYVQMITGRQRIRVQYDGYYVEYAPKNAADIEAIRTLYMNIWNGCPEAQASLPPLNVSSVRRGPPVFGQMGRGRVR